MEIIYISYGGFTFLLISRWLRIFLACVATNRVALARVKYQSLHQSQVISQQKLKNVCFTSLLLSKSLECLFVKTKGCLEGGQTSLLYDVKLRNAAWHVNEFNMVNTFSWTRCNFWTVCKINVIQYTPLKKSCSIEFVYFVHQPWCMHSWAWRHITRTLDRLPNNLLSSGKDILVILIVTYVISWWLRIFLACVATVSQSNILKFAPVTCS